VFFPVDWSVIADGKDSICPIVAANLPGMKRHTILIGLFASCLFAFSSFADGPADNMPESVRRIPPLGIEVPEQMAAALHHGLDALQKEIDSLPRALKGKPELLALIPDVEIYHKAVRYALDYREFQRESELKVALKQLDTAMRRAAALKRGEAPWLRKTGLVVRGFRSGIDGSVQPYGLEIPANYDFAGREKWRLDLWFHGRGERTNEVAFMDQRSRSRGKIKAPNTIVLHPYARYSNANKFAGEIDCLEALEHASHYLRVDDDRTFVRGFSMGGAACWQFATHYADRWAGAQPGAGFSETEDFLNTFQGETLHPYPWERRLWRWYDCTDWALNLTNCPTIAYSGEIDHQIQAARMMEKAYEREGLKLLHLIGPKTAHGLEPNTLREIESRLANIAIAGRVRVPRVVRMVTYSLRYNRMHWLTVDRMKEHWEEARLTGEWTFPNSISLNASGIDAFTVDFQSGDCPLDQARAPLITVNGQSLKGPKILSDRSWTCHFSRNGKKWALVANSGGPAEGLVKRHGLQGPIDDAFMDSFLMVKPSGKPRFDLWGEWVHGEFNHAVTQWRQQFRGDAPVKKDSEVTDQDIANHNLILWGDPSSNSLIAKVLKDLPITWNAEKVAVGQASFDAKTHIPVLIYPNPLNPDKYVVINSSFTYREYDYLNNARQTPKLPDWAIIDLSKPVTSQYPGGIPAAGFFGEKWEVK